MIFKWIAQGYTYGRRLPHFCISVNDMDFIFIVYKSGDGEEPILRFERVDKNPNTLNHEKPIEEEIKSVFIIKTDDEFRKKVKRSYNIIKFELETKVVTIGLYSDNERKLDGNNSYLICNTDYINLLAKAKKIEAADELVDTDYEIFKFLFDKKEIAKLLLR